MKKVLFFSFLFSTAVLSAQNSTDDYFDPAKPKLKPQDRISGSLSVGTGIGSFNKSTFYSAFIVPKIGYQLTNKFKMNIGLMHYSITGNTFMTMNSNEALFNPSRHTATGNLLFAEGEYKLNKHFTVAGAVMTDMNTASKNNYRAASLGLRYETSKHSWISVQTNFSQGESPYYNTHMGSYNFGGNQPPMYDMFGGLGQEFTRSLNNSIR